MKAILSLYFLVLCSSFSQAQSNNIGLYTDITINNISSRPTKIKNARQAVSNALVYGNNSLAFGFFTRNENYIFGASLDVSVFPDDFMLDGRVKISDFYYNHEQFVYANFKAKSEVSNNDIGIMCFFGFKIAGNDKVKLNFINRLGMKNVTTRTSSVILKESGSNTYYKADYKFRVSPITSYIPSLEFEFSPDKKVVSYYLYTGLYFQYFTCHTQVNINKVDDPAFTLPDHQETIYINLNTSVLTGIGIRASLW